jgi:hypothetical protein
LKKTSAYFYFFFYFYPMKISMSKRKIPFLLLLFFSATILLFSACKMLYDRIQYPDLKKVAVNTQERFDTIVNTFFPIEEPHLTSVNETPDSSFQTKNHIPSYQVTAEKIRNNRLVKNLISNYHNLPKLSVVFQPGFMQHGNMAEAKIGKLWQLIICAALIVLLVFILLFLAEWMTDSGSCFGCGIGLILTGFIILLIFGFFDILLS